MDLFIWVGECKYTADIVPNSSVVNEPLNLLLRNVYSNLLMQTDGIYLSWEKSNGFVNSNYCKRKEV